MNEVCDHLKNANLKTKPKTPEGCEECLKSGDQWFHLRECLKCGHVGCCDQSVNEARPPAYAVNMPPSITTKQNIL